MPERCIDNNLDQLPADVYNRCRLVGHFTLRSGKVSSEYFDKYQLTADPALLQRIVDRMALALPSDTEMLGGLELGGVPFATALSLKTELPFLCVRKKAKAYGTCKVAEGPSIEGKNIVLVEDVVTSGGAVLDAAALLRNEGAVINRVLCAIDRQEGGHEALALAGLGLSAVLKKEDFDRVNQFR